MSDVSMLFDRGLDLNSRRVFLVGDIDAESASVVTRALLYLADRAPKRPIQFWVSSGGGELDYALAIHDVIRGLPAPVTTVAYGACMSAAVLLVACGAPGRRFATPHTPFMVHGVAMEATGDPKSVLALAAYEEAQARRMDRLMAEYTQTPFREWARVTREGRDRYLTAEEAVEWGIIDDLYQ